MSLDARTLSVLFFDVLGTAVDERGTYVAQVHSALTAAGGPTDSAEALTDAWLAGLEELMGEARGERYRPMDELNREALVHAATSVEVSLDEAVLDELATGVLCPKPFPDAAPGLGALAERFNAVALSNSTMKSLAGIARSGGLRWHTALSTELARSYKPEPAVYRLALDLLRAETGEALMVSAHPWDLRAAAEQGMRTAYVKRDDADGEPADTEFDIQVDSLAALAGELLSTETD